jgi:glucokinase-like ROK family protein
MRRGDVQSRADLARQLNLSKMTIGEVVADLLAEGIIKEKGEGSSMSLGGRKPILLQFSESDHFVVGLDIGLTNTVVALGNLRGERHVQFSVPTNKKHNIENILTQIEELVETVLRKSMISKAVVIGLGISIGGLIDSNTGYVNFSPDFGWKDIPLREMIEQKLSLPTVVDNCTRCMAFGEQWHEKIFNRNNILYINLGHGIGSSIVMHGRIYNNNSEFGHIKITDRDVRCDCGKKGCLEAMASGHAIERIAKATLKRTPRGRSYSARDVAELALAGNEDAIRIFNDVGRYLGRAISIAATLFNPDRVIIAGGVAGSRALFEKSLLDEYRENTMDVIKRTTSILFSSFGIDAGINGSVAMALNRFMFHEEATAFGE